VNKKNEGIRKEICESNVILSKPPPLPKIKDIDPEYTMLKNVIESIKLEGWDSTVTDDRRMQCYDVVLINPMSTITVKARMRLNDIYPDTIHLAWFHIMVDDGVTKDTNTFDNDDRFVKFLVIKLMWDYVLNYHENENEKRKRELSNFKDAINEQLKTLLRDNKLNTLF
jgi:hypothetical protein